MSAITTTFPTGVAGDLVTMDGAIIDNGLIGQPDNIEGYGRAVQFGTGGRYVKIQSGATAAAFAGVAVRSIPGMTNSETSDHPPNERPLAVLQQGKILVKCGVGTPVKGQKVNLRVVGESPTLRLGDFEATPSTGQTVVLDNVVWAANGKDANNIAQLYVQIVSN